MCKDLRDHDRAENGLQKVLKEGRENYLGQYENRGLKLSLFKLLLTQCAWPLIRHLFC